MLRDFVFLDLTFLDFSPSKDNTIVISGEYSNNPVPMLAINRMHTDRKWNK